jgi:thiol:disulfide interchange protein DsbD
MMSKETMLFKKQVLLAVILVGAAVSAVAAGLGMSGLQEARILPVDEAFELQVLPYGEEIKVHWNIAPGYYLYKDRVAISASGGGSFLLDFPAGIKTFDEYFGDVVVFEGELKLSVPLLTTVENGKGVLEVQYQGCAKRGYCYPPQTRAIELP